MFEEAIQQAGARTVLCMTSARQHAPETQPVIADAYKSIGDVLDAIVVPVGLAWQSLLSTHDQPVLYDRDQSHPTLAGSFLAARVFLAVLLNANPVGIESGPAELQEQDRKALQVSAWKQCGKGSR